MGLLNLFLQNQSGLDITPIPPQGNGPIEPATGEFNTGTTPFQQIWNSNRTYLNNFNPNIQPNTLGQTGLDNTNPNFVPSTTLPTDPTIYPQLVQGEFNSTPTLYNQLYNPNNTYLNNFTAGGSVGIQPPTLAQTGLDVDDPTAVPTTTVPNTLTVYPATALGGLGQSAIQFLQIWTPVINYNDIVVGTGISPLEQSLDETGLDVENQNAVPTTTTPNTVTQYPSLASGDFGGGASQYTQNWSPTNTYLNSNFTNAQEGTLDLTGLDNTDTSLLPTTISPQQVPASPQILPPQTFMGEFGGAPSQFTPQYNPNVGQGYLNTLGTIISNAGNPQISALNETGLDVEDPSAAPTTYVVPGYDNVTSYPANATGEYNGPATPYGQTYTPEATYEDIIVNSVNGPTSVIENSTQFTGLDIENQDAAPTTYAVPQVDNITVYPPEVTGELGGAPSPYNQEWEPTNKYYNFMKENYQAQ
jgi:hypothetical protein